MRLSIVDDVSRKGKAFVYVEKSQSLKERTKGLMNRKRLEDDGGMLFIFPEDDKSPFWMKDTYISLDIIFVDRDYRIIHIAKDTVPLSEDLILSPKPYRYVVELKGGAAHRLTVSVGDFVSF